MEDKELIERVLELDAKATAEPWDCKPDPERENDGPENWRYEDENSGSMTTAVRPFGASVEDTIAECWGTEHDDQANAALIAEYRSAAPALARLLDEAYTSLDAIATWAETSGLKITNHPARDAAREHIRQRSRQKGAEGNG